MRVTDGRFFPSPFDLNQFSVWGHNFILGSRLTWFICWGPEAWWCIHSKWNLFSLMPGKNQWQENHSWWLFVFFFFFFLLEDLKCWLSSHGSYIRQWDETHSSITPVALSAKIEVALFPRSTISTFVTRILIKTLINHLLMLLGLKNDKKGMEVILLYSLLNHH